MSTEAGAVLGFDARQPGKPVFTLAAHGKACSSISFNHTVPNLLATGSLDHSVKLWDLAGAKPVCVTTKKPHVGSLFSVSFYRDSPFLLVAGGSSGKLAVWDTLEDTAIRAKYGAQYSTPEAIDVYVRAEAEEAAAAAAEAAAPHAQRNKGLAAIAKKYPRNEKKKKGGSDDDE